MDGDTVVTTGVGDKVAVDWVALLLGCRTCPSEDLMVITTPPSLRGLLVVARLAECCIWCA